MQSKYTSHRHSRWRRASAGVWLTLGLIGASPVCAQQGGSAEPSGGFERVTAHPIDQRVADINPLAASLRRVDPGLDQPSRFGEVYRLSDGRHMRVDGALHAVFPQSVYTGQTQQGAARIPPGTVFYIGEPTVQANANEITPDNAHRFMPQQPGGLLRDAWRQSPAVNTRWDTFTGKTTPNTNKRSRQRGGPPTLTSAQQETDARNSGRLRIGDTIRPAQRPTPSWTSRAPRAAAVSHHPPRIWRDTDYRSARMRQLLRRAARTEQKHRNVHRGPHTSTVNDRP